MGRFVTNSQGREVYIPSVEEASLAGNLLNPNPLGNVAGLVSPISGAGAGVPDIEVQQPVIYDEERMQFENLLLDEEQNRVMRQRELRALRENERTGGARPFMGVSPRESFLDRVRQQDEQQQREAEQNRIASERDENQRRRLAKQQQIRSRKEALLNSPEALEKIKAVHQGVMSEEDFKTWWVSQQDPQNAHAWEIGVEGDAYQKLWARLNQEGVSSRMAGDLSGKTKERSGLGSLMGGDPYPVADPETRDALLAELRAEHNQRELEKQARLAGRRDYTPRPFDPDSHETYDRLREKIKNRANTNVLRTGDAEDVERAANVHDNLFADEGRKSPEELSSMRQETLNLLKDSISKTRGAGEYQKPFVDEFTRRILQQNDIVIDDPNVRDQLFNEAQVQLEQEEQQATQFVDGLIVQARIVARNDKSAADANIKQAEKATGFGPGSMFDMLSSGERTEADRIQRESRREYQQLEKQASEFLNNPNVSELQKNKVRMALRASGTRLQTSDIESNFELRVRDKVNQLYDHWKQREKRTGKKLTYQDKLDDIRKNHSPMELYVDEKTQEILDKHNHAAALKFIEGYTGETALHYLRFAGSSLTRLAAAPLSLGAAARIPGFETAAIGTSEFFDKADEGYRLHVKQTLGDKRRLRFLGLTPSEAETVVTSAYQSVLLGGFGLSARGIGAGFGFIEAADQYPRALREGLTGGAALSYAFTQGVNEGLPAMLFPGTNKWAKHLTNNKALKGAVAAGLRATAPELKQIVASGAKIFVKDTLTELLTESYTTFTQLLTEGTFIHGDDEKSLWDNLTNKGWEYTKLNIGESLKHTLITVLAQSVLLGGPSAIKTLVTKGFQSLKERRDLNEQELRLVNQMRAAIRQVHQQMAPLVDFIRTSGSVSDRLAEVINRVSPAGAAQLRKLREQGKQISRSTIEKLYGPEIAGRLTKLEQREAFADAILGQKQRVQQEVIDNSPVLQESPTKVVEVEDQQTGERNVVTVNVEQGQTAQEAVDEQVRTATGEAPVVTAEPDTESLDIRDPDSIMLEIQGLEESIIAPETTPAEREAFEKRKRVLEKALNKKLRDRKKETPEAEAPTEAPAEAPVEDAKQKKRAARAFRDSDSKIQQAKEDNDPVALATAAHQLRERGKKFGDDSRVQEADELIAELEAQGYKIHDPAGETYVHGRQDVEAIAWVEQEGIENETIVEVKRPAIYGPDGKIVQAAQVVIASPAEAAPTETAPTEAATEAEKQQQKADEAWKEAGRELTDFLGGGMAFAKKGESRREAFDRVTDKIATALVEQAKATGLKLAELAKKWYAENSKGKTAKQKTELKKLASSALLSANQRLKTDEKLESLNKEYEDLHETLEIKRNAFYLKFPGATLAGETLLSAFKMVQKTYLHYGDILEQTGEAGKRIAITMRNASDKIGRFLGELQPAVIDAHKKFRGKVTWKLQQVQQKGERWGVARIVDLVEGRIEPENVAEKAAVDAIRKLNLETGEILEGVGLLQKTQEGETVKFKVTPEGKVYLRMATEEMRLLLLHRNVGGNAKLFKSVVKAFAEANDMNERQVEAVFVSMAEKYSDVTKLSTHSHIGPELQRAFDVVPTHVLDDNNHWVPLFESFPDQYVDSIASSTAHRAAFVQHFGQDGAIARKLREILSKANGDVVMFDQMLRRISGLPPKPKSEFIVQNNYYRKHLRFYHAATGLAAVGAMTGAAVVNIPEVLVTTIRKMGIKSYLESIVRGMIPRKTLSQKEIDLFKALGVSDAEIANKQKHAKVYSRVADGIIRDMLISSRSVTKDVLLWNVDRNNISASIINRFAGILNRASLVHFMNEAQESRAGLAAVSRIGDIVQRAKRGEAAREADVLMFLQIGMSDSMAQKLANGTADPDNYKSAIRRLVDFLTASTGTPAEKSPYSQTPIWKSNVFFMTYFQGQMRRIHKEVAFLHPRHPFKRRFRAGTEIAKLIGYGATAGQIASLLLGMSFSGRVGWDEWEEEAKKAWEGSLWDKLSWIGDGLYFSLVGGIYATAANTIKSISTDGLLNSTPFNAAKSVMFPIGLGWDTLQYINDSGQYRKKTFVDYLRNRVAGTKRAIPTQIIIGLGELIDKDGYITNPDIQAAFKHYWKWKREFDPKPFIDLGKADKETKEFHVALNRAANLYSKGKVEQADKIIEDIMDAGDPTDKDRKDRRTRVRTYLSRQQKLRSLSDEERKSLKDNVSSTTYEILEAWDEAIEGLKPKTVKSPQKQTSAEKEMNKRRQRSR